MPIPKSSTPALLDANVRFLTPESRIAAKSSSGMPQRPKPPAAISMSSCKSPSRASAAEPYTFFIFKLLLKFSDTRIGRIAPSCQRACRRIAAKYGLLRSAYATPAFRPRKRGQILGGFPGSLASAGFLFGSGFFGGRLFRRLTRLARLGGFFGDEFNRHLRRYILGLYILG